MSINSRLNQLQRHHDVVFCPDCGSAVRGSPDDGGDPAAQMAKITAEMRKQFLNYPGEIARGLLVAAAESLANSGGMDADLGRTVLDACTAYRAKRGLTGEAMTSLRFPAPLLRG